MYYILALTLLISSSLAQAGDFVIIEEEPTTSSVYENCLSGESGNEGVLHFEAQCKSTVYPREIEPEDPSQMPIDIEPIESEFTLRSNNYYCDLFLYGASLMYLTEVDASPVGDRVALTITDVPNIRNDETVLGLNVSIPFESSSKNIGANIRTAALGTKVVECELKKNN